MRGESESLADASLFPDPGMLVALEPVKVMGGLLPGSFCKEHSPADTLILGLLTLGAGRYRKTVFFCAPGSVLICESYNANLRQGLLSMVGGKCSVWALAMVYSGWGRGIQSQIMEFYIKQLSTRSCL